jgi:hypothetical protein
MRHLKLHVGSFADEKLCVEVSCALHTFLGNRRLSVGRIKQQENRNINTKSTRKS